MLHFPSLPALQVLANMSPREIGLLLLPHLGDASRQGPTEYILRRTVEAQYGGSPEALLLLSEGLDWLFREGLIVHKYNHGWPPQDLFVPSRRGWVVARQPHAAQVFGDSVARELVHPRLQDALREMERGPEHFADGVFKAFREVEIRVRERSSIEDKVGVELVRDAYAWPNGVLTDRTMQESEAKALAHLFAGAMGYLKNPSSHRRVDETDPHRTLRLILFASELLYIVGE